MTGLFASAFDESSERKKCKKISCFKLAVSMPLILVDVVDVDYQRLTLTVLHILGGGGGYFFQQKASYPIVVFVLSLFSRKKSLKGFNFSLTDEMLCMNL